MCPDVWVRRRLIVLVAPLPRPSSAPRHPPIQARTQDPQPKPPCEKTAAFLSHLYIKCIFLPRQARDKHRENSKKERRFPHLRSASGEGTAQHSAALSHDDCSVYLREQAQAQSASTSKTDSSNSGSAHRAAADEATRSSAYRFIVLLGGDAAATSAASEETSSPIAALLGESSGVPIARGVPAVPPSSSAA